MKGIYLLLGSNLGDSSMLIEKARIEIANEIGRIVLASSVYRTKAWGIENQPDFLNQVLEVESDFSAEEVLHKINLIEKKLGRIRVIKWHSRIIDIDILYFGREIIHTNQLQVPHKENQHRNFVLVPMAEIAPDLIHPVLLLSQKELLDRCPDKLEVKIMHD